MEDVQTLNADDLRRVAAEIRASCAPMLGDFRRITALARTMERAAEGRASQKQLQAAVDAINQRDQDALSVLGNQLDDAFDRQDAKAWAETACRLLPMLPEHEVLTLMNALNDGLVLHAQAALHDLERMPVAGSC
jgi:hypothetical protein